MHYKRKEKHVNPSVVLRTSRYLLMTTGFMLIILPGDSFASEKGKIPSASIQKQAERSETAPATPLPDMVFPDNEYDVGEVYEGTPVTHSFTVTNQGKADLVIQSVRPG